MLCNLQLLGKRSTVGGQMLPWWACFRSPVYRQLGQRKGPEVRGRGQAGAFHLVARASLYSPIPAEGQESSKEEAPGLEGAQRSRAWELARGGPSWLPFLLGPQCHPKNSDKHSHIAQCSFN